MNSITNDSKSPEGIKLRAQICEVVADVMGIEDGVSPNQTLQSLGADSIDMATLIVTLQDEFPTGSSLDESAFVNIKTAEDIAQFIQNQIDTDSA